MHIWQCNGDFDVETNKVIHLHNYLIQDKLKLDDGLEFSEDFDEYKQLR